MSTNKIYEVHYKIVDIPRTARFEAKDNFMAQRLFWVWAALHFDGNTTGIELDYIEESTCQLTSNV
jgi:hypothetical protein